MLTREMLVLKSRNKQSFAGYVYKVHVEEQDDSKIWAEMINIA